MTQLAPKVLPNNEMEIPQPLSAQREGLTNIFKNVSLDPQNELNEEFKNFKNFEIESSLEWKGCKAIIENDNQYQEVILSPSTDIQSKSNENVPELTSIHMEIMCKVNDGETMERMVAESLMKCMSEMTDNRLEKIENEILESSKIHDPNLTSLHGENLENDFQSFVAPELDDLTHKKYFDYFLVVSEFLPEVDYKDIVDKVSHEPISAIMEKFNQIKGILGIEKIKEKFHTEKHSKKRSFKDISESEMLDYTEKKELLLKFIENNFSPAHSDLEQCTPDDWVDPSSANFFNSNETNSNMYNVCSLISRLQNKDIVDVVTAINERWRTLCHRKNSKLTSQNSSTLLDLPNYFFIPGGRFRETYYWDTYWILEGLIACGMTKSVRKIMENFIYIINTFGIIPNGCRSYYLTRSQPPYFPLMLEKALEVDPTLLEIGLQAAEKEYEWWMQHRSVKIKRNGKVHRLNLFKVMENNPRLESFKEDMGVYKTVFEEAMENSKVTNESKLMDKISENLFSNLKSAAESGYDFSSRWLTDPKELSSIAIIDQIPVDLNAVLFKCEQILSNLFLKQGNIQKSEYFKAKSIEREEAINTILWNEEKNVWMDFNFKLSKFQDRSFYVSNLIPLVYGIKPKVSIYSIVKMYEKELFYYPGGIPVSGEGIPQIEQWDFPNAWPPHQHMAVQMFSQMNEPELALNVAQRYYQSVSNGFKLRKDFDEKYLSTTAGGQGDGGEYLPQKGFGWTNGVFLSFVDQFGDKLSAPKLSYEEITSRLSERLIEQQS